MSTPSDRFLTGSLTGSFSTSPTTGSPVPSPTGTGTGGSGSFGEQDPVEPVDQAAASPINTTHPKGRMMPTNDWYLADQDDADRHPEREVTLDLVADAQAVTDALRAEAGDVRSSHTPGVRSTCTEQCAQIVAAHDSERKRALADRDDARQLLADPWGLEGNAAAMAWKVQHDEARNDLDTTTDELTALRTRIEALLDLRDTQEVRDAYGFAVVRCDDLRTLLTPPSTPSAAREATGTVVGTEGAGEAQGAVTGRTRKPREGDLLAALGRSIDAARAQRKAGA